MIDLQFNKNTSVALSGHRELSKDFSKTKLKTELINAIENGYKTFYNGLAQGFDLIAMQILVDLKKEYNINIVCCIPHKDQAKNFSIFDKKLYNNLIEFADKKVIISQEYFKGCMFERNRYMVDNSTYLITYLNKNKGGTFYTYKYALKNGLEIKNIANVSKNLSFFDSEI